MPDKDEFLQMAEEVLRQPWFLDDGERIRIVLVDSVADALRTTAEKYERIGYQNAVKKNDKKEITLEQILEKLPNEIETNYGSCFLKIGKSRSGYFDFRGKSLIERQGTCGIDGIKNALISISEEVALNYPLAGKGVVYDEGCVKKGE